ncbi:MAG TPA: hypothetical protein VMI53_07090 [Opitutaceae bacterium]|nr:hypothetical protein [Opitutaceae bacterium]
MLAVSPALSGGPAADARFKRVAVEPVTTSIFIGHITLTAPVFVRGSGGYTASYQATVFPFFFWSEHGQMTIEATDDDLRRLERGETVEFHGHAENSSGESRRVEGRAVPEDTTRGKLKVRIFVSRRIQLTFNTTYRFTGGP